MEASKARKSVRTQNFDQNDKQRSLTWININPVLLVPLLFIILAPILGLAHGVKEGNADLIQDQEAFQFWPFFYLGAKHMLTGFGHLGFLAAVIFSVSG